MKKSRLQPWEVLKNQELFVAKPWIKLSVQQVRLADGSVVDDYYQVRLPEFTVIFAQTTIGGYVDHANEAEAHCRCRPQWRCGSIEYDGGDCVGDEPAVRYAEECTGIISQVSCEGGVGAYEHSVSEHCTRFT